MTACFSRSVIDLTGLKKTKKRKREESPENTVFETEKEKAVRLRQASVRDLLLTCDALHGFAAELLKIVAEYDDSLPGWQAAIVGLGNWHFDANQLAVGDHINVSPTNNQNTLWCITRKSHKSIEVVTRGDFLNVQPLDSGVRISIIVNSFPDPPHDHLVDTSRVFVANPSGVDHSKPFGGFVGLRL
jgi:hypothetical protein